MKDSLKENPEILPAPQYNPMEPTPQTNPIKPTLPEIKPVIQPEIKPV